MLDTCNKMQYPVQQTVVLQPLRLAPSHTCCTAVGAPAPPAAMPPPSAAARGAGIASSSPPRRGVTGALAPPAAAAAALVGWWAPLGAPLGPATGAAAAAASRQQAALSILAHTGDAPAVPRLAAAVGCGGGAFRCSHCKTEKHCLIQEYGLSKIFKIYANFVRRCAGLQEFVRGVHQRKHRQQNPFRHPSVNKTRQSRCFLRVGCLSI